MVHDTVVGHILRTCRDDPGRLALIAGPTRTTYGELRAAAGGWAATLARHIEPGSVVGVLRPRGTGIPVCHLGIWLAGAAYLPLDPVLPDGRVAAILDDARCSVVVTTRELAGRLPPGVTAVTAPDVPPSDAPVAARPDGLAYVIYTSGTTGSPKGVEIEHHSVERLMRWYRTQFGLTGGVRVSMLANLMFDGLVLDVWGALSAGATLAVPGQDILATPQRIGAFLDEYEVAHAYLPTPMLERYLATGPRPRSLRSIATGGDRLRVWPAADFPAAVHNTYGPTEATVLVTASRDLRTVTDRTGFADIGAAVAGAQVWLEDDDGARVSSPGAPGELVIAGPLLARGYRHAPELTAAAFGAGHYRSGDLCRWTPDGWLEFLGRRDTQVKVRGYRVELGEIEQVLLRQDGVEQAVVVVTGEGGAQELLAFVEGAGDGESFPDRLAHVLPDYMVPDKIMFVAALPATASGKVDRAALQRQADGFSA